MSEEDYEIWKFQFLIGRLGTIIYTALPQKLQEFQFLIGRLGTLADTGNMNAGT